MKKHRLIISSVLFGVLILVGTFSLVRVGASPLLQGSGSPTVVSYQGVVEEGGAPYTGTGYFKFALVDPAGTTSYWSNDGTSTGGGKPTDGVQLTVEDGLFHVLLGDTNLTNMTALAASAFEGTERYLRIWFSSDGSTYTQLTPDRRIAAVPYALQAQEAAVAGSLSSMGEGSGVDADLLDGIDSMGFVQAGQADSVTSAMVTDGEITDADLQDGAALAEIQDDDGAGSGLDADTLDGQQGSVYQYRVSGSCKVGSTIRSINADGTVNCEPHDPLPGFSRSTLDSSGQKGAYSSITIGIDGLPIISYRDNTNRVLKVAHCEDIACKSAKKVSISGSDGGHHSITVGSDGLPIISSSYRGVRVIHCDDLACDSYSVETFDTTLTVAPKTSITIGTDSLPIISYYDGNNGYLKVLHCDDLACSSASMNIVDSNGIVGDFPSITIGSDGLPIISYYDRSNKDLKVAHCNDLTCASATTQTLDSVGDVGFYTSISIGTDGSPVIGYWDLTNRDLKIAHCDDVICSSVSLTIVDSVGDVGRYTSVSIGSDGFPVISYEDRTNNVLKVAHCNNASCSSASRTTVDNTWGDMSAISIGMDGLPIISYRDVSNLDLKVVHCSNLLCIPYWRKR
jgi:hypothetical protein